MFIAAYSRFSNSMGSPFRARRGLGGAGLQSYKVFRFLNKIFKIKHFTKFLDQTNCRYFMTEIQTKLVNNKIPTLVAEDD